MMLIIKKFLIRLFFWSWILTLPIAIIGSYWIYNTIDRFYTYAVRYKTRKNLQAFGQYEMDTLIQRFKIVTNSLHNQPSHLKTIQLFISDSNLANLQSRMPQSGFEYVKGAIDLDGKVIKAKIKYRGDFSRHWAWNKKSIRVKTTKKKLFNGIRSFNLLVPKFAEHLNNYFSYRLAEELGILAPKSELVRVFLNDEDQGIHIFVEQLKEITLRQANLMPADIYRGEIIAKDAFADSGIKSLLSSTAVWDKISINNHYAPDSKEPLNRFLYLIRRIHKQTDIKDLQTSLSDLLDLEAWGRFSALESLTQTRHFYKDHNWRLYYDPWRQKIIPIVWDPIGWKGWIPKSGRVANAVMSFELQEALFMNGDFIRAREQALQEFFQLKKDENFLDFVADTIVLMEKEIQTDPFLRPADPIRIIQAMGQLKQNIKKVFSQFKEDTLYKKLEVQYNYTQASLNEAALHLSVQGHQPIQQLRLDFDTPIHHLLQTGMIYYDTPNGQTSVGMAGSMNISENSLTIRAGFLPNLEVYKKSEKRHSARLRSHPGNYKIKFNNLNPNLNLMGIHANFGNGWREAKSVSHFNLHPFGKLYAPVIEPPIDIPLIWSGNIIISGVKTIEQPLVIQPGTQILMEPQATLILKNRLSASGTKENPIRFLPRFENQKPWGAFVLLGKGANGSSLKHCEMSKGSGLKGSLFEYSAMFSVHDVKNVAVSDCLFKDSKIVDDMIHAVYSKIRFERSTFQNAFSDALDLDISDATIINSQFENSGNDAIDLMTTKATVINSIMRNNGDKGISVGENSQLLAINNQLIENEIGVQAKDRSVAILFNQTLEKNKMALNAYMKNWRYGEGGVIYIAKSKILNNTKTVSAKKRSTIWLYDTYVDQPLPKKRIRPTAVDNHQINRAVKKRMRPKKPLDLKIQITLKEFGDNILKYSNSDRRGAQTEGRPHD